MLNLPEAEIQKDKKYAGGRRGMVSQMPKTKEARKFLTEGREGVMDVVADVAPGAVGKVFKGIKKVRNVAKAVKGSGIKERLSVLGRRVDDLKEKEKKLEEELSVGVGARGMSAKTADKKTKELEAVKGEIAGLIETINKELKGSGHKNKYEVEEDALITTGSERLKRVKGKRGGAKKKEVKEEVVEDKKGDEVEVELEGGAKKRAHDIGEMYAKEIVEMDDDVKEMVGKGFFEDFGRGFMKGLKMVLSPVKAIASVIPHPAAQAVSKGLDMTGFGKTGGSGLQDDVAYTEAIEMDRTKQGGGRVKKVKRTRVQGERMKKRGALIKKLMKEKGMTLPQASKYIKEHDLV